MGTFSVPVTVGNLKTAATETVTAEIHNRDTYLNHAGQPAAAFGD